MQICNSTLGMEHPRKLGRNARRGEERVPNRRCGFCQTRVTTVGGERLLEFGWTFQDVT
jgi:hypothetical protein